MVSAQRSGQHKTHQQEHQCSQPTALTDAFTPVRTDYNCCGVLAYAKSDAVLAEYMYQRMVPAKKQLFEGTAHPVDKWIPSYAGIGTPEKSGKW